ncbi:MAG: carboxypeptidase-like regulatory domain-containing protein [Pirellulales bacterium]|nr:carboxypeptidase-like regulatory domain-containing protein [Pirellulales bacterium]
MRFQLSMLASVLCLFGLVCGCGGGDPLGRRAVSGTVTLDGAPLAEGSISFEPVEQSTTSSGAVIANGAYAIAREQGLPPGKYRVVINAVKPGTGLQMPEGGMPGDEVGTPAEELIPAEWNTESENFIEVGSSGPTEFKHEIVTKE